MSRSEPGFTRDLIELILGYGLILFVLWMPEFPQRILSPVALVVTLTIVLARRPSLDDLGVGPAAGWGGRSGFFPPRSSSRALACWLPSKLGTLHPLYKGDFKHIGGYVVWTLYQQFLHERLVHAAAQPASGKRGRCRRS